MHSFFQGVESERCPSFTAAREAGKPVKIDVNQAMTLADGRFQFLMVIQLTKQYHELILTKPA